jgi:hypothetical protein
MIPDPGEPDHLDYLDILHYSEQCLRMGRIRSSSSSSRSTTNSQSQSTGDNDEGDMAESQVWEPTELSKVGPA